MARFDDCLAIVLKFEGGYVNNPADPGGATNYGITQRTYDSYRMALQLATQPVRSITMDEVSAIYDRYYWLPAACQNLPQPVDLCVFDAAVNSGVSRSDKTLQAAAGVTADGLVGPATLAAVNACDPVSLATQFLDNREQFYRDIVANKPDQNVFFAGWMNRVNQMRHLCGVPGY